MKIYLLPNFFQYILEYKQAKSYYEDLNKSFGYIAHLDLPCRYLPIFKTINFEEIL